jgi:hypothetical protein
VRRNIARISAAGTFSQEPWGGKLGGQQGSRGFVGEGQPTDESAVSQRDPFLGIDLPDLVGFGGAGGRRGVGLRRSRAIDARPDERLLKGTDGGDVLVYEFLDQFNTN